MLEALETARPDPAESGGAVDIVTGFAIGPPPSELLTQRDWIDASYAGDDAQTIVDRLAASPEPHAREAAATILSKSPTSVAVTLAALRRAPSLADVRAALDQDLRIATRVTRGSEVLEGIRAQVIDKDRTPHWNPATLAEVSPETVAQYFEEHV
jgi:enoyl-CoA hydratase